MPEWSGIRGTKVHCDGTAAASTPSLGSTRDQSPSMNDAGANHRVRHRTRTVLLNPAAVAARAERREGQNLAPKTTPSLLLHMAGRRIRQPPTTDEHEARGAEKPPDPAPEIWSPL